jgi:hypothetical protein
MNTYQYGRAGTAAARLREWCHSALLAHEREGTIPTTCRFIFYEAVMAGVVPKHRDHGRRADQDVIEAIAWLREKGLVPWGQIVDRTRRVTNLTGWPTVLEAVTDYTARVRLDPWDGEAPLLIVESESLAGLFETIAAELRVVLVPVRGQSSASLLVNEVCPWIEAGSTDVVYVGDHDKAGYDIEASAHDRLEGFSDTLLKWERVALTAELVEAYGLPLVPRTDQRNRRTYEVAECEAMPQAALMGLVRDALTDRLPQPLEHVRVYASRPSVTTYCACSRALLTKTTTTNDGARRRRRDHRRADRRDRVHLEDGHRSHRPPRATV